MLYRSLQFRQRINLAIQRIHRNPLRLPITKSVDQKPASHKLVRPMMNPELGVPAPHLIDRDIAIKTLVPDVPHVAQAIPLAAFLRIEMHEIIVGHRRKRNHLVLGRSASE